MKSRADELWFSHKFIGSASMRLALWWRLYAIFPLVLDSPACILDNRGDNLSKRCPLWFWFAFFDRRQDKLSILCAVHRCCWFVCAPIVVPFFPEKNAISKAVVKGNCKMCSYWNNMLMLPYNHCKIRRTKIFGFPNNIAPAPARAGHKALPFGQAAPREYPSE